MDKVRKILIFSLTRSGCLEYTQELLRAFESIHPKLIICDHNKRIFPNYHHSIKTYDSLTSFLINTFLFIFRSKRLIKNLTNENKNSVIYCPSFHPWNLILALYAKRLNIPFFLTVHDFKLHPGEQNFLVSYFQTLTMKLASMVVFLTESQSQLAINQGFDKSKIIVLNHPLFYCSQVTSLSYNPKPRLLFLGRIKEYKGVSSLIEAVRNLEFEKLTIAGEGDLKIKFECSQKILILNQKLTVTQIHELLENHEVLILPYKSATQSGVLSLGISKETVMLITKLEGLQEQVSDHAAFWAEPNAASIRKALENIISNENEFNAKKAAIQKEKIIRQEKWNIQFEKMLILINSFPNSH